MALKTKSRALCALMLLLILAPVTAHASEPFLARQQVQDYIQAISDEHDLDANRLSNLFAEIHPSQSVLDAMSKPAERVLNWSQYRPIFITDKRITAGRAFAKQHKELLLKAEQTYGVPASVIAAIIGVETFYGRITGKHRVLESVATLAFDYPPRAKFFKSELDAFLVLALSENWDVLSVKGSYAGAMGWPQFIASSYQAYSVDFDGDGKRDLFNSLPDVIGSVANYLARHGWKTDSPIAEQLSVPAEKTGVVQGLLRKSLKPAISPQVLRDSGFDVVGKRPVSIMKFAGKGGEETWVGYTNFYAITRYNHSKLYALAVFQLSRELAREF